jgi:hypothetical protein
MLVKWDYIVETWDCMLAKSDYMLVRLGEYCGDVGL